MTRRYSIALVTLLFAVVLALPLTVQAAAGTMSVSVTDCTVHITVNPTASGQFAVVVWDFNYPVYWEEKWTDDGSLTQRSFDVSITDGVAYEAILWDVDTFTRLQDTPVACESDDPGGEDPTPTPDDPTPTPDDPTPTPDDPTPTPDDPTPTPDDPTPTPDDPTPTPDDPTPTPDDPTPTPDDPTPTPDDPTPTPDDPTPTPDDPTPTPDDPTPTPDDPGGEDPTPTPDDPGGNPGGGGAGGGGNVDNDKDDSSNEDSGPVAGPPFNSGDARINMHAGAPAAVFCNGDSIEVYGIDPTSGEGWLAVSVSFDDMLAAPAGINTLMSSNSGVELYHMSDGRWAVRAQQADGKTYEFAFGGCPYGGDGVASAW